MTEGLKVKCPNCKQTYHVTTDKFNPIVLPTGGMVKLLKKYIKLKWSAFANGMQANDATNYAGMRCPSCQGALCVKNRLVIIPNLNPCQCTICGKICKTPRGMIQHKELAHA